MRSRRRKRQKKRRRMSWQSWYNRNDVRKQVNKVWFWGWPRSWRSTAPSPSPSPPHATFISEGWGGEGGGAEVSLVVCPNLKVCQRFMPLHLMWMKRTWIVDVLDWHCQFQSRTWIVELAMPIQDDKERQKITHMSPFQCRKTQETSSTSPPC